jgi:hypothetical protein
VKQRYSRHVQLAALCLGAFLATFLSASRDAGAVPSFARKYQTSCQTCHTIYPALNAFGEAFRRDGYRFPSQGGSVDSDAIKEPMIPMGQEEYAKTFPDSVWPDKIAQAVPLSVMFNGAVSFNFPNADTNTNAGNTFTWGGIVGEVHLFGAGSLNDSLTYFTQLTIPSDGPVDIETAYVLWNDIVGPRHLVNLWVGRLMNPQLTSFGHHSSYLNDTFLPMVSIAGLYNATGAFQLGMGHTDGVEANGIIGHRVGWSLGWVASAAATGFKMPDAEDAYAHIGVKSGGIALDGEGKYGPTPPDPMRPWAERSITVDAFAYHGMNVLDNGTGTVTGSAAIPVAQRDGIDALGGSMRLQLDSLLVTSGLQLERHTKPYSGTAATANPDGTTTAGAPDLTHGNAWVQFNEVDYVVFPWLVPGVRTELTHLTIERSNPASLLRVVPGVAMLVRANIKLTVTGDFERAYGLPVTGSWSPAGGSVAAPSAGQASMFEAEQIQAGLAVAY